MTQSHLRAAAPLSDNDKKNSTSETFDYLRISEVSSAVLADIVGLDLSVAFVYFKRFNEVARQLTSTGSITLHSKSLRGGFLLLEVLTGAFGGAEESYIGARVGLMCRCPLWKTLLDAAARAFTSHLCNTTDLILRIFIS